MLGNKEKLSYSLTPQDVAKIVDDDIKVILSSDFGKLNNIDELIDPRKYIDKVLILFRREHKTMKIKNEDGGSSLKTLVNGHYCALMKLGNKLCFYDPYGDFPTDQLNYIHPKYREETDQVKNYLADLLINSPYELHYNPHKHQQCKLGINTCGRHCAMFLKLELEPEEYNDIVSMNNGKDKYMDNKILRISNRFMNNDNLLKGGNNIYLDDESYSSSSDDENEF